MNTHPSPPMRDQLTLETLDPCAWRYVLTMDDLASYRLTTRSDVIGTWEIVSTTYCHFYCKVKVGISAQCFTHAASKSGKSYNGEQSDKVDSAPVMHTRVFLLSPEATRLTKSAFAALEKDTTQTSDASRAYHESQSRIYKLAPESFEVFSAPNAFQELRAAHREPRFARSCIVCEPLEPSHARRGQKHSLPKAPSLGARFKTCTPVKGTA